MLRVAETSTDGRFCDLEVDIEKRDCMTIFKLALECAFASNTCLASRQ